MSLIAFQMCQFDQAVVHRNTTEITIALKQFVGQYPNLAFELHNFQLNSENFQKLNFEEN